MNDGNLWTAQERETVLSGLIENEGSPAIIPADQLDRAVTTVAALIEALEAILNGQLTGNVDPSAERFQNARALLDSLK